MSIELTNQEIDFLIEELKLIIDNMAYSNTNKTIAKNLLDKLLALS